ncbi:MAG: exodeoxyribonuclease III [marine bacterium B5-7]|nr:MAG: exodeoxyribonuclease III [marine bacterium B5-7]
MKIATWNVNSLRTRLPHVQQWLAEAKPDVLAVQEIKVTNEQFPTAAILEMGYEVVFNGQKTHHGVATFARDVMHDVCRDIPGFEDLQRRVLATTIQGVRVVNVYVPNGGSLDSDKYPYKLAWLAALRDWLAEEIKQYPQLVLLGDFNIAPADEDIHDPAAWADQVLCSAPERAAWQALCDLGLQDAYRLFDQPAGRFSWWDYRQAAYTRNLGLRIDTLLMTPKLAKCCTQCVIDEGPRRLERPSDHAPVWAALDLN